MTLKELEKKRKELEKKAIEIEAKRELNQKELERLKKEILEATGLKSLENLDEYVSRLEQELQDGKSRFARELSELEASLVDVLDEDVDDIKEDLDEI